MFKNLSTLRTPFDSAGDSQKDPCEDWMMRAIQYLFENGKVSGRGSPVPLTKEQGIFKN